jgi:hypothetical protein
VPTGASVFVLAMLLLVVGGLPRVQPRVIAVVPTYG